MSETTSSGGGLVNMGLTCYGNSVIQNLRNIPKVLWIMEDGHYNTLLYKGAKLTSERETKQNLTKAFAEVVQLLTKCKSGQSVRPGHLWSSLVPAVKDTLYEQFARKMFHDAHEFFHLILECIHQSTIQDVDMKIVRPPPTTPHEKLIHQALESWQMYFSKEYSPFVHIFYGMFHQKTVCDSCKNVTHRWEPFNSLKVPISSEPCDIFRALGDDLSKEEKIEEYQCDACGPPRKTVTRYANIWKMPQVLVLNLKRCVNNGQKINTPVMPVPLTKIDMSPYYSEDSPERIVGECDYMLRGTVDHHGGSTGGHYTAQSRHSKSDVWNVYDDESVHPCPAPTFGSSTYMLFLEKA